uniref:Alternative protein KCTD10 n=1 Tax=Homo sapiens TaxID=9606 RepID=L8E9A8_HUMAN|nr:alternative protein KCTD10 [Homo sapiens]
MCDCGWGRVLVGHRWRPLLEPGWAQRLCRTGVLSDLPPRLLCTCKGTGVSRD